MLIVLKINDDDGRTPPLKINRYLPTYGVLKHQYIILLQWVDSIFFFLGGLSQTNGECI